MKTTPHSLPGLVFRVALFAAAASLALYIPYKYHTQLHAVNGLYAFMFPLSSVLAVAGTILAIKPAKACDCGVTMRSGLAVLGVLWLITGVMCVGTLTDSIMKDPVHGSIATFHMIAQHVFLSLAIIGFAVVPDRLVSALQTATASQGLPESPAPLLDADC